MSSSLLVCQKEKEREKKAKYSSETPKNSAQQQKRDICT